MTIDEDLSGVIRTPDQRLRVFVSSTLAELADERAAVGRAITALRLTPVMFELGARPYPPRELYRAYLAQSDIFVGLYWQRYGWVGPGMDISGLEDEFRLSTEMPRLLYVKTPAPDREAGLTAMIAELQSTGDVSYRSFKTPRELGRLVRDDLALLLSEQFVSGSSAPRAAAAVTPVADRRSQRSLPVTSTPLFGREHDVAEVSSLLQSPDVRLVTLTGPGGIGKTRLAIAVAEELNDRYPNGAVFVPLASITRPELVLPRIAEAVGATLSGAQPPLDVLVEQFADHPTLLVLDNLEQVVAFAPELDALLQRCSGLDVLATSRSVLRLGAEREYAVSPLTVPALGERPDLSEVASLPAVQLFVDRARAVRYDFALTEDNAPAILDICRRLDGLPLAIELAAARTRLLDPKALLTRLGKSLDSLGTGPVSLPERQRTLRATVEWSIGLLTDDERTLLATLSAFVDGWTLEAATFVAGIDEDSTLDLLDWLAGHSLVQVGVNDDGPRFRMLESVRDLAAEQLASDGEAAAAVEHRHASFFRTLVDEADWPTARQSEWAERIAIEEGNIRRSIGWLLANDVTPLPHMFRILWLFWQMRGRMPEGRRFIAEALLRATDLDDKARAELLFTSAVTAVEVGDDETALAAVEDLEQLQGTIGDAYLETAAQLAISWILPLQDDLDGALRAASTAFDGFHAQDEPFSAFAALTVGMVELALGRLDDARVHLLTADDLGRRFDNSWLQASARAELAAVEQLAGRLDDARTFLATSVDAENDIELSTLTVSFSLVAAARIALATGDVDQAATALGATDGLRQRAGLRGWPSVRRTEAELVAEARAASDDASFARAFAAGSELTHRDAIALVRAVASSGSR